MLFLLHGHPGAQLALAHTQLGESYASGEYLEQAYEHWLKAKQVAETSVYDDGIARRLEVPLLSLEGFILLQSGHLAEARGKLQRALELSFAVYGKHDPRRASVQELLGRIATSEQLYPEALDYISAAYDQRVADLGPTHETSIRLWLQLAHVHYLAGEVDEALARQARVLDLLVQHDPNPGLLVETAVQLAAWQEEAGLDGEALRSRQIAEQVTEENGGKHDPQLVRIKRDIALLVLKQGENERALEYLQEVEHLERQLYGSSSLAVARTLKAIGTVHLVLHALGPAEEALAQALMIFERNQAAPHQAEDIRVKLTHIDAMRRDRPSSRRELVVA